MDGRSRWLLIGLKVGGEVPVVAEAGPDPGPEAGAVAEVAPGLGQGPGVEAVAAARAGLAPQERTGPDQGPNRDPSPDRPPSQSQDHLLQKRRKKWQITDVFTNILSIMKHSLKVTR